MKPAARVVVFAVLAHSLAFSLAAVAAGPAPETPTTPDPRRSGFSFMTPAVQAMQRDDAQNPAMLWVVEGEALWNAKAGTSDKACATCHGAAPASMLGVAARYPAFDAALKRPVDLRQRIQQCRVGQQQAVPWPDESADLLSVESYVALQSRGAAISPPVDARLQAFTERGAGLYRTRIGQLDFSCAQCHDDHAGQRLGGSVIPQAHPTGYPLYRLEWQGLGSLQRRLRNCMAGVRAEPFTFGSAELVELELYLMQRAAGMAMESPAVRP